MVGSRVELVSFVVDRRQEGWLPGKDQWGGVNRWRRYPLPKRPGGDTGKALPPAVKSRLA